MINKLVIRLYCKYPYMFTLPFKKRNRRQPVLNSELVFLVPPTTMGSLGDEAMLVASITHLTKLGKKVTVVSADQNLSLELKSKYGLVVNVYHVSNLYSGFLCFSQFIKLIIRDRPSSLYVIGADVMDGYYSKLRSITRMSLLDIGRHYMKDVRLLGFSFNASPDENTVEYLKKLADLDVKIQPRDPVSSARLDKYGIQNTLVSDLAFLLEKNSNFNVGDKLASQYMDELSDRNVICVNLNAIHLQKWGDEFYKLSCNTVGAISDRIENTFFIFVSHDTRSFDDVTDLDFAKLIVSDLGLTSEKYFILPDSTGADALKYIASRSFLTLSGRMHFAIGSMGAGTPAIMFGYQGKQEGLAKHFQLDDKKIVINPVAVFDSEHFDDIVNYMEFARESIARNRSKVIDLSMNNFV